MADKPVVADRHEHISVPPVVVEADLGEDREVAVDSCLIRAYVGEADVGQLSSRHGYQRFP
jgi:hypothetical protein